MKTFGATLAIAGAASAAAIYPRQSSSSHCCFNIEVSGGSTNGLVGQLADGQIRAGPGYSSSPSQFCFYNGTTTIVDGSGRGCLSTAPTTQLQCDAGLTATSGSTPGFSITSSGEILSNGTSTWYECNAANQGYNVYTSNPGDVASGCSPITLSIVNGNCSAPAVSSSSRPASSAPASSAPASSAPVSSAPASSASATTYACNPAHSYPGSTCISTGTGLSLVPAPSTSDTTVVSTIRSTVTASPPAPASSAPASSAPAPPAPASSAPASSAPAPVASSSVCVPGSIIMPTETVTVTVTASTAAPVASSPAASTKTSAVAPPPASSAPASSAPAASTKTSTVAPPPASSAPASSAPAVPAGACPTGLGNKYEYPHLIVPVDSAHPDTAYGTQYFATINGTTSTIFNFDIPASSGTCTLEFLLPLKKDLETSDYTGAAGSIKVTELASVATQSTTFNNQPAVAKDLGTFNITPGSSTIIFARPCKAGAHSYELTAEGTAALHYFQDYNPSPIGLYVVEC